MKKAILILFLMTFSFAGYSQKFDTEKAKKDISKIIEKIDTSKIYAVEITDLLKKEVKMWGWKKTLQENAHIFLPITLFLILYLVWLKNRK